MAARLVDQLADLVLAVAMLLDQLPIALGLLDRVQILALDILDQRDLGGRRIVDLADDRRDGVQPRPLRRPPAALAGDDLDSRRRRAQQDRLQHASLGNRFGQLVERLLVEMHARLVGIGPDPRDLDLAHAAARVAADRSARPRRSFAHQRRQAAAEPLRRPLAAHAASAQLRQAAPSARAPGAHRLPSPGICRS